MKAKFINEDLGDVLKPKTVEDIKSGLTSDPLLNLKHEINKACKTYWIKGGIKFNKITTPEQFENVCLNLKIQYWKHNSNRKITESGASFIPVLSTIKNDYYGIKIILYGYMELGNKKFSDKLTKISENIFPMDLTDKQQMKNINF
jgi:hypothetical protein